MLATRFTYLALVLVALIMNGWSLLTIWNVLSFGSGIVQSTLLLNLIIVPLCIWGAYRIGQLSEEKFRREEAETIAALKSAAPKSDGQDGSNSLPLKTSN